MPIYEHLLQTPIKYSAIPARVKAAYYLGAPYDQELTNAESIARTQAVKIMDELVAQGAPEEEATLRSFSDSQVIALIAYLQRVGTDLTKDWSAEDAAAAAAAAGESAEAPADQASGGADASDASSNSDETASKPESPTTTPPTTGGDS